jgi:hypothetical protein
MHIVTPPGNGKTRRRAMMDRIATTPYPDTEEEPVEPMRTPGTGEEPEGPDPFDDDGDDTQ